MKLRDVSVTPGDDYKQLSFYYYYYYYYLRSDEMLKSTSKIPQWWLFSRVLATGRRERGARCGTSRDWAVFSDLTRTRAAQHERQTLIMSGLCGILWRLDAAFWRFLWKGKGTAGGEGSWSEENILIMIKIRLKNGHNNLITFDKKIWPKKKNQNFSFC